MDNLPDKTFAEDNVPTSERVLLILRIVAGYGRPVSASDLIRETGLNKSTLYRLLASLRRWGFVMETDALYSPGSACLQLSLNFDVVPLLTLHGYDAMHQLNTLTQETVAITVVMQQEAVCISMIEPRQSLRCSFEKGRSLPLHSGATAKCLLAHLPATVSQPILQSQFGNMFERQTRIEELNRIRQQGYACTESEVDAGVWGISVPLLTQNQQLLGALTLMAPIVRAQDKHQQLIAATLSAADAIHQRLRSALTQESPAFSNQS